MTKFVFTLLIALLSFTSIAQIKGTVTDTNSKPLPSVNIYIEDTYIGTSTNDAGNYELNVDKKGRYRIVFQYLGYKTIKKDINVEKLPFVLDAQMAEEDISLNEVIITSEGNPADNIIRKAIANRKANLEKINSYTADFYSRGLIRIKNAPEKILGQDIGDLGGGLDSTRSGIIYLSETISKIEFLRPDKLKEKITASKVSGNDSGFSFNTAMDVDYNFYENTIELGSQMVSPIANNAFGYYRYTLEGAFFDDKGNLINKIKVTPKRINDPVFSGFVYIVENQWNLYAVELNTSGTQARIPAANTISIQQDFSFSEKDRIWAKISQTIDFNYGIFGVKGDGRFTYVYSNYVFNATLTKKDFGREILSFEIEANKKDSTFWQVVRPVPLTVEERTDYIKKDSIQTVRDSKVYKDSVDAVNNKFKFGNLLTGYNYSNSYEDWHMGILSPLSTLTFNTVQGWNANINAYYRKNYDKYKRYLLLNGTVNYGFSDEKLRGTVSAAYKFDNIKRAYLNVYGGVEAKQFNESEPISKPLNTTYSLYGERNYMKLYERTFAKANYTTELFNGLRLGTALSYEHRQPLRNTTDQTWYPKAKRDYTSNNPQLPDDHDTMPFLSHHILKFGFNARINFGQDYISHPDGKYNIPNSKYPTLFLRYEKGFAATNDDYNFDKVSFRATQSFSIRDKGTFEYNLKMGKFFSSDGIAFMDYHHFNGNQTHIGEGSYLNVFNNLPYYTHSTNDAYMEFHAEHDFNGFLLGKLPLINKLNFNLILGAHALATPNTKPYQEYTIGIDNIGWGKFRFLRVDYVRSYQSGFVDDAWMFGVKFF
ncbi:MAG TPA: DUF5686 and carboxypeptidase regulatory-like domain-containing protein [Aquaticitalea sp.]|nr:DUF5686 and carboxypeptidase regulatory-like domain-containing protein [Aquaticitalea sp.]